jgi:hypothetical protein
MIDSSFLPSGYLFTAINKVYFRNKSVGYDVSSGHHAAFAG